MSGLLPVLAQNFKSWTFSFHYHSMNQNTHQRWGFCTVCASLNLHSLQLLRRTVQDIYITVDTSDMLYTIILPLFVPWCSLTLFFRCMGTKLDILLHCSCTVDSSSDMHSLCSFPFTIAHILASLSNYSKLFHTQAHWEGGREGGGTGDTSPEPPNF